MQRRRFLNRFIGGAVATWAAASGDRSAWAAAPRVERLEGNDWPAFLGPTGDSKSAEKGILTDWPAQGPPLVWQRRIGQGYSMPTVSQGRLYQAEQEGTISRLVCLASETGELIWKFEYRSEYRDLYDYDAGPRCSPVVNDGIVYLLGVEGMLHALRVDDGQVVWKLDTVETFGVVQNFFGVGSTPVVEGDLLIVQIGGSPKESRQIAPGRLNLVQPNGAGVVAFDKRTGAVRYQVGDELASYASPIVREISGRRWCFVFARGGLLAFEPATGRLDFHYPWRSGKLESVNASNPVVVDDLVFISETYGPGSSLLRIQPDGYEVVWADAERSREKALQTHWNTPIHVDGFLYGSSGRHSHEAELRCVELMTGKVAWSHPGLMRSSLLYVDGHFICLSEDGALRLLKANSRRYDEVARAELVESGVSAGSRNVPLLRPPAWAAPILAHGLLYVRGRDRLVCLELIPKRKLRD